MLILRTGIRWISALSTRGEKEKREGIGLVKITLIDGWIQHSFERVATPLYIYDEGDELLLFLIRTCS